MYLDDSVKQTEVFEGKVPTMYLDTKGNVTVAVGLLLPTLAAAQALPFFMHGMGEDSPATAQEIEQNWNWVKMRRPGLRPSDYQLAESVFMSDADMDKLLRSFIVKNDAALANHFANYGQWPDAAKLAYLDMVYNLGPLRLFEEYPRMNAAAAADQWHICAAECGRDSEDPAFERRNAWTKQQFLAAQAEKIA